MMMIMIMNEHEPPPRRGVAHHEAERGHVLLYDRLVEWKDSKGKGGGLPLFYFLVI